MLTGSTEEEEAKREEAIVNVDVDEDGEIIDEEDPAGTIERPLRVAIVGRPNAGKSTLINQMVGEDRMLTGPEAGITRDSISVDWDLARPAHQAVRYGRHPQARRVFRKSLKSSPWPTPCEPSSSPKLWS
jgi:predicted GTPase